MNAKRLKRFLSVLLSMSMALSLNTVSFAAEANEAGVDAQAYTEEDAGEALEGEAPLQEEPGEAIKAEEGEAPQAEASEEPGEALEAAPQAEAGEAAQAEHTHDWVRINDLREPTCTKAGVAVYQCQNEGCDAVKGQKYEAIPKLGHTYDPDAEDYVEGESYTVDTIKAATCQQEGSEKHICKREGCGEEDTVPLPKTDHQWNEEEPKTADANCLEAGKTYIGCLYCEAVKPGSVAYDEEKQPKLGHGYDREGAIENTDYAKKVVPPTCLEDGYTEYTCMDPNCPSQDKGKVVRDEVEALGHGYEREGAIENTDYTKETTTATCTQDGGETYTCMHCTEETEGHTCIPEDKKVGKLGHGYDREDGVEGTDYSKTTVGATCTTGGYTEYTCEDPNCPDAATDKAAVRRDTVQALGHGYNREGGVEGTDYSKTTVEATCTTDGYTEYTCKHCTEGTEGHTCQPDNEKVEGAHKWGAEKELVAVANCKDPAQYDFVCSVCGAKKGESEARGTADASKHVFDPENAQFSSVFKPATCKINGLTRLTCTFCENATEFAVVEAGHDYEVTVDTKPTCTTDGTLTKVCQRGEACDDPETKTVTTHPEKTGHDYNSEVTTPATCITEGEKTNTCKTCGDETTESIDADPENHTNWSEEGEYPATCTRPGFTGKYCLDCGEVDADAEKTGEALGHRFEREGMTDKAFEEYVETLKDDPEHAGKEYVKVTKEATCKEEGKKVYTCPDCDEEKNTTEVVIDKTDHNWDKENAYVKPTCTENGKYVLKCIDCGEIGETQDLGEVDESEKATGHKYTKLVQTFREETCVKNGVAQYKCETCDLTENRVIPAAHKYEIIESESTAATCTEAGREVKECKREVCADPENKRIENSLKALEHSFDEGTVTKDATCVEEGVLTKTCQRDGCGQTTTEKIKIDPDNHKNMQPVTNQAATCTVPKILSGSYCDACGEISEDAKTEGEPLGHRFERSGMTEEKFEEYVESLKDDPAHEGKEYVEVTKEPSCTEGGTKVYTCPDCSVADNTTEVPISALDHHFVDEYTAPTCTENGKVQKKCDREGCDATGGSVEDLGELDPKLGHNITVVRGKKATCQETGLTDGKACDRKGCGYVEVAQEVTPVDKVNGHNWSGAGLDEDSYRAPTCKTAGFSIHTCENCGEEKSEILPAGHDWKECFADGTEAFADADTILYRVCSRAGDSECDADPYEVLVVLPGAGFCEDCEKYVWKETVEGTPADCTNDGMTDGEKCPHCDYVFKAQETMDALGHRDTTWETVTAPTCKDAGMEKEICGICEEETGETRPIAATGKHQYTYKLTDATCTTNDILNSVCKVCGRLNPNNVPQEFPGTALGHDFGQGDVCSRCQKGRAYAQISVSVHTDGSLHKIRFTATSGVADEERYQLLDRGILYITNKAYCEDPGSTGAELVVGNINKNNVRCTYFPEDRAEDTYYVAINVTNNESRNIWARAYTRVMDLDTGKEEVIYSDFLSGSFDSVTAAAK